jgi:maltooligosyltrehalose trehalohydrolase
MPNPDPAARLHIGAEVLPPGGVKFRVWAPRCRAVDVVLEEAPGSRAPTTPIPLQAERDGYFSTVVPTAGPGTRYRYRLDRDRLAPDLASRFQPDGPFGPSEVIDPSSFEWTDRTWRGIERHGQVLYELHIGTFTPEGTWRAAEQHLAALADLGVTALQVMPVHEFPGAFGWSYDSVGLYAPTHLYGRPDDFRHFVDRAHAQGLGVILDVVYNHVGPEGSYFNEFASDYFTDRYENEWGEAINFDSDNSGPVRHFFIANAGYWIHEFHLDGLRVDACQQIFDSSPEHVLTEITRRARSAADGRPILLVAETESQNSQLGRTPEQGGHGFDCLWSEDFHHLCTIALLKTTEAYYADYRGTPQEFVSLAKCGFLYQGQINTRQKKRRGSPITGLDPEQFVFYLQNHDQVANTLHGDRVHHQAAPPLMRALTAFQLLVPCTPMLFQGQEFAASSPFAYFSAHQNRLSGQVFASRKNFLRQFASLASEHAQALMPDPNDIATFERCRLDHAERVAHREALDLHRDLLRLRRDDPVFCARTRGAIDGAVLGRDAFLLRYFGAADDRLLICNWGCGWQLDPAPEPLLAPPAGRRWAILWSSEDPRYGGGGTAPLERSDNWWIPGQATVAMSTRSAQDLNDA